MTATRNEWIGLLATRATARSGAFAQAVLDADPHIYLTIVAAPDLAPIIQRGLAYDEEVVETVRGYCAPLREAQVDTVVLGCTHYPLVRPMLQRFLGSDVRIVSTGTAAARQVERALRSRGLDTPREGEGRYSFLCTGDPAAFRELGTRFLQMPLGEVTRVEAEREALAK